MKISVVYVFPNLQPNRYVPLARRFVSTYMDREAVDHQLHIVVNGPAIDSRTRSIFDPVRPTAFHGHNNEGKDLGAFVKVARELDSDLAVFLGSPVYFPFTGWLERIKSTYLEHGPGFYGCWGFKEPSPHIRTTAFWMSPELFLSYPYPVDNGSRYRFEHGRNNSMLNWVHSLGFKIGMVTRSQVRFYPDFDHVPLEDCLMFDQHVDRHHL